MFAASELEDLDVSAQVEPIIKAAFGGVAAERALPEHVIGGVIAVRHARIHRPPIAVEPGGIEDAVLVEHDRHAALLEPTQRARRQIGRVRQQIDEVVAPAPLREAFGQAPQLHERAAYVADARAKAPPKASSFDRVVEDTLKAQIKR